MNEKNPLLSQHTDQGWIPVLNLEDLPNILNQGTYDKDRVIAALVHDDFQQYMSTSNAEAIDYITKLSMPIHVFGFDNGQWSWSSVLPAYVYMYDISLPDAFVENLLSSEPENGFNPVINIKGLVDARRQIDDIISHGDDVLDVYVAMLYRRRDEIRKASQ